MDALLLMAGDQPLVRPETLTRLLRAFEAGGRGMACLMDGTHRGNPAVFRQAYFGQLAALTGDRGAGALLCGNEADLLVVPCADADELSDADTPQALERIHERLQQLMHT